VGGEHRAAVGHSDDYVAGRDHAARALTGAPVNRREHPIDQQFDDAQVARGHPC
jgi:hypothetical protein